jgi:hypothetical protein
VTILDFLPFEFCRQSHLIGTTLSRARNAIHAAQAELSPSTFFAKAKTETVKFCYFAKNHHSKILQKSSFSIVNSVKTHFQEANLALSSAHPPNFRLFCFFPNNTIW